MERTRLAYIYPVGHVNMFEVCYWFNLAMLHRPAFFKMLWLHHTTRGRN